LNFRSPVILAAIGVVATLVLALAVVMVLWRTGGGEAVSDNAALIGALVALGGVFTAQMVSIILDDRRHREARELENVRVGEARALEERRAAETALRGYFEDVGMLLIEKKLRRASPGDNLSTVVRAQTLSVLAGLDPYRKGILLRFLYESGLIYERKLVVSLAFADLSMVKLSGANLSRANLRGVNLRGADLGDAFLSETVLSADLEYANLSNANLINADLSRANLSDADLSGARLVGANLSVADLSGADLSRASLWGADLSLANLGGANLSGVSTRGANLSSTILSGAILRDANLMGTSLSGATGITTEELEQQAASLEGVIMPDGSKHP
jgi:uncharacterized protein YjbI with pentapeptide repeats